MSAELQQSGPFRAWPSVDATGLALSGNPTLAIDVEREGQALC